MKSVAPTFELDNTVANADWIKAGAWDLPPYQSKEFFMQVSVDQLDWFRTTVTYKSAVAKGLIYDDEWVADSVIDPMDEFLDDLMVQLDKPVEKRDTTFDGILPQEYPESVLCEQEMDANRVVMDLAQICLTLFEQDDQPGARITGRACNATLQAVTNYDISIPSRAGDHQRAYDLHLQAVKHYDDDALNPKAARAHEATAQQHKKILEELRTEEPFMKLAIDEKAHEAATSPLNDKPEPSDAMKEAGNYEKGHIKVGGLDIAIENPAGSKRRLEWPTLAHHYGYIKRTTGADDEHIDCFVRPGTDSEYDGPAYVIDQLNADGSFDEHKVMIGFSSSRSAVRAYLANYKPGWKVGKVTRFSWEGFKAWCASGPKKAPVSAK